jgi:hypothetical protein
MTWIAMGEGPPIKFEGNSHKYNYGYYLANDIYPRGCAFIKPVTKPQRKKQLNLTARKDV